MESARNDTQSNIPSTNRKHFPGISIIRRGIALLVLIAAVTGGVLYWQRMDHAPKAMQKQEQRGALPVQVVTVETKSIPLQPVHLGQTEASRQVEIHARVSGFLESRDFEEGGRVAAGQILFRIDPRSFKADLDIARARLASAQAQLVRAQQKVERYTELLKSRASTTDEVDQWRTEAIVAHAAIELEQARVLQAELNLSYTTVESPIDGDIGMAQKDVGSYVDSNKSLLAVVEKTDPIYVRYSISEQDLLQARRMAETGMTSMPSIDDLRLTIILGDGSVYSHEGHISYISPKIDTETGTMIMRGSFPNPEGMLKPGQFVHVRIKGMYLLKAVMVPKTAVLQNPTGAMVYVVNTQNQAEIRPVTLGKWHHDQWIIENGLQAGDRVICDKLMQLRPGFPVEPISAGVSGAQVGAKPDEEPRPGEM